MAIALSGSLSLSGSITATGNITAQTLVVQTITSSVEYSSGSNVFGNVVGNTQQFTGSVLVSGSMNVNANSLVVNSNGTVSIGNTNSTYNLDVTGTGRFTGALSGTSATFSANMNAQTYKGSTYEFYVINNAASSNLLHHDGSNLYVLGNIYVGGNGFSTGTAVIAGTGTTNYLPKFTGTSTIGNSGIYEGTSGFISIGNTNSTYNLDVTGTGRFSGMLTSALGNNTQIFQANSATTGYQYWNMNNTSGQVQFGVESSTGGSLISGAAAYSSYIGTNAAHTAPFYLVTNGLIRQTIDGSTGAATFSSSVNVNTYLSLGTGSGKFLAVGNTVTAGSSADMLMYNTGGDLNFWATGGVGMIVKGTTGNVGIGTSSPASKLSMGGAVAQSAPLTYTPSEARQGFFNTYYSNSESLFPQYLDIVSYGQPDGTNGGGIIRFLTNPVTSSSAAVERMRITSGGYLKASPNGTYLGSTGFYHEFVSNAQDVLILTNTNTSETGNLMSIQAATNTSNNTFYAFSYYNQPAAAYRFRIADSGNATNTNGSYGTISSDRRLKENIVSATPKLDDIMKLNVVNFNLIGNEEKHIGFIAQEMKEVFPSFVYQTDTREYDEDGNITKGLEDALGVKTGMEFAILVKAIQEQQATITTLTNRIIALENK